MEWRERLSGMACESSELLAALLEVGLEAVAGRQGWYLLREGEIVEYFARAGDGEVP